MTDTSPEVFTAALALLAAVGDVPGCKARIAELKKQLESTQTALRQLAAETAEHERKVAADTAELDARAAALRKRQVAVSIAEREVNERAQIFIAAQPPPYHDPNLFGTISRKDPDHG